MNYENERSLKVDHLLKQFGTFDGKIGDLCRVFPSNEVSVQHSGTFTCSRKLHAKELSHNGGDREPAPRPLCLVASQANLLCLLKTE